MKKIISVLFLFILFGKTTNAQNIVQDFSVTDVNGEVHNLYEILDDGKIVIINAFATSCSTCWTFQQSGKLENLWQQYGPNGTDELFVISVEINTFTDESELFSGSFGDWTEGISYPIANADIRHILSTWQGIQLYEICPNRVINRISKTQLANTPFPSLNDNIPTCMTEQHEVDALLLSSYVPTQFEVCQNGMYNKPEVIVQNIGTEIIHSLTFEIKVFESQTNSITQIDTITYFQNLETFQSHTFFLPQIFLKTLSDVSIEIIKVNGSSNADQNLNNNKLLRHCDFSTFISIDGNITTFGDLQIEIETGLNGHEIYWAVIDEDQSIIGEGGNINEVGIDGGSLNQATEGMGYQSDTTYWEKVELPHKGCYEFIFVDAGGDKTPNYNLNYTLWSDDGTYSLARRYLNYESYSSVQKRQFEYVTSTITNTEMMEDLNLFKISPNPSSNFSQISFSKPLSENVILQIHSSNGKIIAQNEIQQGVHNFEFDTTNLPNGIYFLKIKGEKLNGVKKLIVQK